MFLTFLAITDDMMRFGQRIKTRLKPVLSVDEPRVPDEIRLPVIELGLSRLTAADIEVLRTYQALKR